MIGEIGLPVLQFFAYWCVLCCAVLLALLCSLCDECTRGVYVFSKVLPLSCETFGGACAAEPASLSMA